ncbi:uncharacterized protein cep295 isoform X3 [Takifugu flavidus]|uniref:uncharacterized protein cep295 isoform X3 n=1 Tax=Takifugu flavidus TaxID=433684 RepID=UPI002544959F|nr:uncharacterized protein cep295 isoform X3 [Takifugu flavidus]
MKRKVARLKLSPNEEARILREEYERRRKLRIQQVREQQRGIALNIRRAVEQRRQQELEQLGKELREEWEREQREKINTLQKRYQESLQLLGQGQRSAKENEPDWAAIAQREQENHAKAEERFREALKELKSQRLQHCERQNRSINARKKALEAEKERSARVASLPLPPPKPIQNIDFKTPHRIRKLDASAFATTYYHMADRMVEREVEQNQPNAHEEAEVQLKRLQEMDVVQMRRREEQLEKAHLRGQQALRREHLEQDHGRLLVELEHMQQRDLLRRRQQVAKMPPQPLYKRAELEEDFQRQMEFAFEDMYPGERGVDVDLVGPEPLLELSAGIQDLELDVTQDEAAPPSSENVEQETGRTEPEPSAAVEQVKAPPQHPLKKLLDRIRSQKNQWLEPETPAELPTVVPERDTTMDTGSLTSEERSNVLPVDLHQTGHHASEASEESTDADTQPPDERVKRHQRAKWNEELEKAKLEQLALLRDLEEQKAKLEQMLLESQQEKNQLQTVVTHGEHQPESIISDHGGGSAETTQLSLPPGEDDHSRQIREHQHQLLERSRVHQASLEAARQHLEDYQRALQARYSMDANEPPPHQPPPLSTWSSQLAAALSHLPNSAMQTSLRDAQTPPRENLPVSAPCTPDLRAHVESVLSNARPQASDVCPSLAGVLLERIKGRLRDGARPGWVGALPQDPVHPLSLGPTKDLIRGRREEQQVVVDHRQPREVEHRRQHLPSEAQPEPIPVASPEEQVSGNVGQIRRRLLQSLLKAIEQRNGGTLSHLEDVPSANGPAPAQSGRLPHGSTLEPLDQREPEELDPGEEETGSFGRRHAASQVRWELFASGRKRDLSETPQKDDTSAAGRWEGAFPEPVFQNVSTGPSPSSLHPGLVCPSEATRPPVTRVRSGVWETSRQHELSAIPEVETSFSPSLDTGWERSLRLSSHGAGQGLQEGSPPLTPGGQNLFNRSRNSESSSGSSSHLMWTERVLRSSQSSPQCSLSDSNIILPSSESGADDCGPALTAFRAPEAVLAAACPGPHGLSTTTISTTTISTTTISTGSYVTSDPDQASDKSPPLIRVGAGAEFLAVFAPPGERVPESPGPAVETLFSSSRIQGIIDKYTRELNFSLRSPGDSAESGGSDVQALGASGRLDLEENERTQRSAACASVPSDHVAAPGNSLQREGAAGPVQERDALRPPMVPADPRDLEHLVGQPSAHSSLIGHLPGFPFSVSLDQSGWDSTLTRMFGRFGPQWQDPGDLQPLGQLSSEHLTTWFDGSPEESQMKPLAEELDESAGQQLEAERSRVDLGALDEVTGPSDQESPPTASRAQTSPADPDQGRSPGWESFQLLVAEVTHNDPADASMSVWAEQNPPEGRPPPWDPGAPFSLTNHSLEPEQSREFFRAKDPGTSVLTPPASQESFSLLLGSPEHICASVLESPSIRADVGLLATAPGDPVRGSVGPLTPGDGSCLWDSQPPALLQAQDLDHEKGILEQSQITLVSLTDTSLQDPEDAAPWGDQRLHMEAESGSAEAESGSAEAESGSAGAEPGSAGAESGSEPRGSGPTLPATPLEVDWGPGGALQPLHQHKRKVLLQKLSRRAQTLRTKGARSSGSDSREQLKPPAGGGAKVDPRPEEPEERSQTAACPGSALRPKAPGRTEPEALPKIPGEQRKLAVAEMLQRTRRLYGQLEEVKQQRAVRSRQQASSQNRLKAKEFHQRTLQKLRAKQTPH